MAQLDRIKGSLLNLALKRGLLTLEEAWRIQALQIEAQLAEQPVECPEDLYPALDRLELLDSHPVNQMSA